MDGGRGGIGRRYPKLASTDAIKYDKTLSEIDKIVQVRILPATQIKKSDNIINPDGQPDTKRSGIENMTKQELFQLHSETCKECLDTMVLKNHDYTGGNADPFANFRISEVVGVNPILGILNRSLDKFKRIETFVTSGNLEVKNESVEDAFKDVINYMVLGLGMAKETTQKKLANDQ